MLIYGELPTSDELKIVHKKSITEHTLVHEDMKHFFEAYPSKAHQWGFWHL
ncbi:MAG: hypothetical protein R2779_08115 [Crocinitomicaceae bacterium]